MAEHPNAIAIREMIAALNDGDTEKMASYLADDVVWHYIGETEPIRSKAAMTESMSPSGGDFSITANVHDVLASDDHVVALVDATATRGDRSLTYRTAEIAHLRDGKVTERWAFSDDTARIVDFFA